MKHLKKIVTLWILLFLAPLLSAEEKYEGMAINIPDWIKDHDHIVEVCYFRHIYIAPTKKFWKARHIHSGVITKVIKGNLKVGTRIDNTFYNDSPGKGPDSTKLIEGKIKVVFLEKDEINPDEKDIIKTHGFIPWFDRVSQDETDKECRRALKIELAKTTSPEK